VYLTHLRDLTHFSYFSHLTDLTHFPGFPYSTHFPYSTDLTGLPDSTHFSHLTYSTKAFEEFGFKAKTSFEEGLKKTIEWYPSHRVVRQ
jgi:nucleoside-diphosphate-sugar epimerase